MKILHTSEVDADEVRRLANPPHLSFEHLDWVPSRERLFANATFAFQQDGELTALICVSPETENFAWLRFFYSLRDGQHSRYFHDLLAHSTSWLRQEGIRNLYSLGGTPWLETLLNNNSFVPESQLVNFSRDAEHLPAITTSDDWYIREMTHADLHEVLKIDQLCFDEPWQLNRESLYRCYYASARSSLLVRSGEVAAYQVSTRMFDQVHLARIAVLPEYRGLGFARALISDVFNHFKDTAEITFSVNTQIENKSSIMLYQQNGFKLEELKIPVYVLPIPMSS